MMIALIALASTCPIPRSTSSIASTTPSTATTPPRSRRCSADDTVFENTGPAPDGTRLEGKAAVAAFWEKWFVTNPDAQVRGGGSGRRRRSLHRAVDLPEDARRQAVAPARHRCLHGPRRQGGRQVRLRQGVGSPPRNAAS